MFRTKQKIYLSCENFKIKQFSKKLDYQKMRVFKMKQQTKLVTFELELSKYFKTHFIIHVILLESALENTKLAKIMNIEEYKNQNYVVEKILAKKQIDETDHYFVK